MAKYCLILLFIAHILIGKEAQTQPKTQAQPQTKTQAPTFKYTLEISSKFRRLGEVKPAKYFLIAGSNDVANFAREVVELRNMLLYTGVKPEMINCYFTYPNFLTVINWPIKDEIYRGLKNCYLANWKMIREDIKASEKVTKDFIFVYATSHGGQPLYLRDDYNLDKEKYDFIMQENPQTKEYLLTIDGLPQEYKQYVHATGEELIRMGDYEDLFFTPTNIKKALNSINKDIKKYVVIQGCFSGGFITQEGGLKEVENITVLTSSDDKNPSFGCGPGTDYTVFGRKFLSTMWAQIRNGILSIDQHPWSDMYQDIAANIKKLEVELIQKNPKLKHSSPSFFSNI